MANTTSTPASPSSLIGDISQLQRWAQNIDNTITELSRSVARLSNLLDKIISLNSLKKP